MPKERFEDALGKLEKVVSKLEAGDIPLEESLKLFEEGIRLSRFCNQKLDEVEKRVEILLKGKNGEIKPEAFDPSVPQGRDSGQSLSIQPGRDSGPGFSLCSGESPLTDAEADLSEEEE